MRIVRFCRGGWISAGRTCLVAVMSGSIGVAAVNGAGLIPDKDYEIHPYVEASVTHDSNGALATETSSDESDVYGEAEIGLGFSKRIGRGMLSGSGHLFLRRYDQLDAADHEGGGERLSYASDSDCTLVFTIYQSYQRTADYARFASRPAPLDGFREMAVLAEDRASRSKRDEWNFGGRFGVDLTDKMVGGAGYNYSAVIYDGDALQDYSDQSVNLDMGWKITPKSVAFVEGSVGIQTSDALDDDPLLYRAHAGWRTQMTGKMAFKGGAGAEVYDTRSTASDKDSDRTIFSYDVTGIWMPRHSLSIQLMAHNSIEPSTQERDATREIHRASLSAAQRVTGSLSVSVTGSYRAESYDGGASTATGASREVDSYGGMLGAAFQPPNKWYSLFADVSYEMSDSNLAGEDFDQTRITAGGRVTY